MGRRPGPRVPPPRRGHQPGRQVRPQPALPLSGNRWQLPHFIRPPRLPPPPPPLPPARGGARDGGEALHSSGPDDSGAPFVKFVLSTAPRAHASHLGFPV